MLSDTNDMIDLLLNLLDGTGSDDEVSESTWNCRAKGGEIGGVLDDSDDPGASGAGGKVFKIRRG